MFANSYSPPSACFSYDGKVYQDAAGTYLLFNPSGARATLTGLTLILETEQPYDLIETGRMIDGKAVAPIDNPDIRPRN